MKNKTPYNGLRIAACTMFALAALAIVALFVLGIIGIFELEQMLSTALVIFVVLIAAFFAWFLSASSGNSRAAKKQKARETVAATMGIPYPDLSKEEKRQLHHANRIHESKMDVFLNTLNLVLLALSVVIIVIPLLNYFSLAFNDGHFNLNVVIYPVRPTLAAMKYVLLGKGAEEFWTTFMNSVIITGTVTVGSNLMMALAAYPLSKRDYPFRSGILMFFVITMLFSSGIIPIYLLMSQLHLTNTILCIILISLSNVAHMLYFKTFFEGISTDIEEAARLDGASDLQLFFLIIIPMSLPIIGTCCFFTIVGCWNSYGAAMMFISDSNTKAQPLSYYLYLMLQNTSVDKSDPWLQANTKNVEAAAMLASIVPIILMYPYVVKYIKGGLQLGSVKG